MTSDTPRTDPATTAPGGDDLRLAVISSIYPTAVRPQYGVFVQRAVHMMARHGAQIDVISPQPLLKAPSQVSWTLGRPATEAGDAPHPVTVHRPPFLSLSNKSIGPFSTNSISQRQYYRAVRAMLPRLERRPDVFYGHFLYPNGWAAVDLGRRLDVPSVVVMGESGFAMDEKLHGRDGMRREFAGVGGIVALSSRNRDYAVNVLGVDRERTIVLPNGIDRSVFRRHDKAAMREKLGLPQDKRLIAFTGWFIERKGPDRLLAAVEGMDDVGVLLLGSGPLQLESPSIVHKGSVAPEKVPEFLSAADIFVLPTLNEGSSNATVEAMACGLPVVGADREFNDDILTDEVSVRVDPTDPHDIRRGIEELLRDDGRLRAMQDAAERHAELFDLNLRARKLLGFLRELAGA